MKLRTMRAIDFWVGVPLCFFCTGLVRLFGSRKGPERPRRVLFVELSEMGSTVIANPAMEKARDELGAEIFFLIFERDVWSVLLVDDVRGQYYYHSRDQPAGARAARSDSYYGRARPKLTRWWTWSCSRVTPRCSQVSRAPGGGWAFTASTAKVCTAAK